MLGRMAQTRRALTLLEVVIAITLIGMLLGSMVTFFWQVVEVRNTAAEAADRMQIARQVLDRISAELRGCVGITKLGFPVEQPLVEEEFLQGEEDIVRPDDEIVLEEGDGAVNELTALLGQQAQAQTESGTIPLLIGKPP